MSVATKKRYRSAAERVLWLGMLDPGPSSEVDLSRVGLPAKRREWRLALVVSVALVSVVSLIWLR